MEDARDILFRDKPFTCKLLKDGKAQVFHKGKPIAILVGKDCNKLVRVLQLDNVYELQLFLAKVTGQFKHGNEKDNKAQA